MGPMTMARQNERRDINRPWISGAGASLTEREDMGEPSAPPTIARWRGIFAIPPNARTYARSSLPESAQQTKPAPMAPVWYLQECRNLND